MSSKYCWRQKALPHLKHVPLKNCPSASGSLKTLNSSGRSSILLMLQEKIMNCRKVRSYFIVLYDKVHIARIAQVTVPQTWQVFHTGPDCSTNHSRVLVQSCAVGGGGRTGTKLAAVNSEQSSTSTLTSKSFKKWGITHKYLNLYSCYFGAVLSPSSKHSPVLSHKQIAPVHE